MKKLVTLILGILVWGFPVVASANVPMYHFSDGSRLPDGSIMLRDNAYKPASISRFQCQGFKPLVLEHDQVVWSDFKRLGPGKHKVVLHKDEVVWVSPQPTETWQKGETVYGSFEVRYIFLCGNLTSGQVIAPIEKIHCITKPVCEKVAEIQEKAQECFKNTQNFNPVFVPVINIGGGGGPQMVQSIPTIGQILGTSSTGGVFLGGGRGNTTFTAIAYGGNGYGAAAAAAAAAATSASTSATPTSAAGAQNGATSGTGAASP